MVEFIGGSIKRGKGKTRSSKSTKRSRSNGKIKPFKNQIRSEILEFSKRTNEVPNYY
jgi:hypothetical protein